MMTTEGRGVFLNWLMPIMSGLLLLAVSGLSWYARDSRTTLHRNTERIVATETEIANTKGGISRLEGAVQALDSKFDRKFDELLRELRQDARASTGHTGTR